MNFLKKIFSPIILTMSFLLLIYTFYKSEIYWGGEIRGYYSIYYLISSILILFSVVTFFINQKIKKQIIISGITIVIFLYLAEGYFTFKDHLLKDKLSKEQILREQLLKDKLSKEQILKEKTFEKKTGNKWDRREKIKIYRDLKKLDNNVSISFLPSRNIYKHNSIFPLSGISNSKTIFCNENGYYSIYQSDKYGFNNPNTEWKKKEIEYLLIGDSFTHGSCVNRPNDISSVLRSLSNKSVLNLGQSGNGPLIEYATLKEYLNKNVKNVLWIYFEGNDLHGLENEKTNAILVKYLNDSNFTQNLKLRQNEINILVRNIIKRIDKDPNRDNIGRFGNTEEETFKSKLIKFLKIHKTRLLTISNSITAPTTVADFKKIMKLTKELVEKNNSKLYFIYLPEYNRFKINYDNTNYSLIKNIITELNISFIDIHNEVFKEQKDPLKFFPFGLSGHFNVEGYKITAEQIYKITQD